MAPKKPTSKAAADSSSAPSHDYKVGDVVLAKVKGYPEWPAKLVENDVAGPAVLKQKQGKPFLARFYPDGDFHWANLKELKPLPEKAIKAYLEEPSHKKGKLRTGYETALDPTEWEEKISKQGVAGGMAIDEEDGGDEVDEDVDMLDEDGGEETGSKTKKRKRATGAAAAEKKEPKKKETAAKAKAPASKKRKADEDEPAKKKAKAEPKAKKESAAAASKDKKSTEASSEGEKSVKSWRITLQKAFLTKGVPAADKMDEFDGIFTAMEAFEMQPEWLTASKLGKVLKKMAAIESIPRDSELKLKERSNALIEKWKEMMVKEGEDATAVATDADAETGAGDLTMVAPDNEAAAVEEDKKDEETVEAAEGDAEAKKDEPETNGSEEKVEVEETAKTNGNGDADMKDGTPAVEETKDEAEFVPETDA